MHAQPCPTLCDPMDCTPPGSNVHGFPRQEYWNGLPFPPPGDLPDPGIEPMSPVSPALQADSLLLEPSIGEAHRKIILGNNNNYPRTAMSLLLRIGSQHFLN